MLSKYNELYNNDAYVALSDAVKAEITDSWRHLDIMLTCQDRAIGYCNLELSPLPIEILESDNLWEKWQAFAKPFINYYEREIMS